MSTSVSAVSSSSEVERYTGRVKWFNNKAGYGFVTVTDGQKSGTDVFVHHSSIKVDSEQYKYLVQGEYIEFSLSETKTSGHEFQAGDVSGIKGGKLMCETRRDSRSARSTYRSSNPDSAQSTEPVKMPQSVSAPRRDNQRPRAPPQPRDEGEWTYVVKKQSGSESEPARKSSSGRGRGRPPRSGRGEGRV
jgi:CspA family cold shock protein